MKSFGIKTLRFSTQRILQELEVVEMEIQSEVKRRI